MPDGSGQGMLNERDSSKHPVEINTFIDTTKVSTFSRNVDKRSQLPYFDMVAAVAVPEKQAEGVAVRALNDSGASDTAINYALLQTMPNFDENKLVRYNRNAPVGTAAEGEQSGTVVIGEIPIYLAFTNKIQL